MAEANCLLLHFIAFGLKIVFEGVTKTALKLQLQVSLPLRPSHIGKMLFLHLLEFQLDSQAFPPDIVHLFPVIHYTAAYLC
jgi:hypothetical protein